MRSLPHMWVALPLALFIGTGVAGLDFGKHWDEHLFFDAAERTAQTGILLPGMYSYPSVGYWLTLAAAVPDLPHIVGASHSQQQLHDEALKAVQSERFHLRVRALFLVVASLLIVWVYLLVLVWRRSALAALLAAFLLATSWQLAYHARWAATDALVASFGALVFLLSTLAHRRPEQRKWIWLAAAACGVTAGCKYPGALLLFAPLAVELGVTKGLPAATRALRCARLAVFAGAIYVVTTPGTLLEPLTFVSHFTAMMFHYATESHGGFTVSRGPIHFLANLRFIGGTFFSPHAPLAIAISLLALAGARAVWREDRRLFAILVGFPVLYVSYMSMQRVMVVRNLLVATPPIAVLAARGAEWLAERLKARNAQLALVATLALVVSLDGAFLVQAAVSIRHRSDGRALDELGAWLAQKGDPPIRLSPRVRAELCNGRALAACSAPDAAEPRFIVLHPSEGPSPFVWPANDPRMTVTTFGPREVDFNCYPSWQEDRILVMTPDKARAASVPPSIRGES